MSTKLSEAVSQLESEFLVSDELLNRCVDTFVKQAEDGRARESERGLPMIPTYVTGVPTGKETGLYLAADLGGTNFRVCSVRLLGDHKHTIEQHKWPIPLELMRGTSAEFFAFLAQCVDTFLHEHHQDHFTTEKVANEVELKMGFTFSFPTKQTSINHGTLLRWTKSFDIKDAVGEDVCAAFQSALNARHLRVHVAALINDTVGALMARAYANENESQTVIGTIFGTGTNAAYYEKIPNITKYDVRQGTVGDSEIMSVNTEWGSFDNDLTVLPNTRFDVEIDKESPNTGFHMFEKRISGLYLGEILRRVLFELQEKGLLFATPAAESLPALETPWSTDTSVLSIVEEDKTSDLTETQKVVAQHFGYDTSLAERQAIQQLTRAIARRALYLSASAVAGLLKLTSALDQHAQVDIGGDGSVFEFYPVFQPVIREALRKTFVGDREKRITFGLAKDGSGVGAALCALMS